MYKIKTTQTGSTVILKNDTYWIPADNSNSDYQQYLAWVAEGNTAEEWSSNAD